MMVLKSTRLASLFAILILIHGIVAFAYDDEKTHPDLTLQAVKLSNLETYLIQNLGNQFSKGYDSVVDGRQIVDLLRFGSTAEDDPATTFHCRASTHFHNPLKEWGSAGASEVIQTVPCSAYNSPNPDTQYLASILTVAGAF